MAFQTQAPTGASPGCSAFPSRSVACSEYPKWIILCHVYRGCPGLLVCFGLFVLHMTCGQVFILVKGDPGEGKCIMLAGLERWWPRGKVTAVRDYLIHSVVLCSGQSPRTGFRVGEAASSGRWWLWSVTTWLCDPPHTLPRNLQVELLCCSPRTANPAKIRARESFSLFYKGSPGIWAVWWVLISTLWRAGQGVGHRHCPRLSLELCAPSFSWSSLFVWLIAVAVNCSQN